jgi:toxin CcdB
MAKYDVYRLPFGEYVVDCQADLLEDLLRTRFVAPLLPAKDVPRQIARLHPAFEIETVPMVMATHLAATVPTAELGQLILSLREHQMAIDHALDMLITGV